MTEKKMIEKESKKERTKDKEKNEYSSFHYDPLFVWVDSFFRGFKKEFPSEEFKISNSE